MRARTSLDQRLEARGRAVLDAKPSAWNNCPRGLLRCVFWSADTPLPWQEETGSVLGVLKVDGVKTGGLEMGESAMAEVPRERNAGAWP